MKIKAIKVIIIVIVLIISSVGNAFGGNNPDDIPKVMSVPEMSTEIELQVISE